MEGYFPGVSRVRVITPSLGRLQDLITGPGPITVIFSRLVTVSAKSMSIQRAEEAALYLANPMGLSARGVVAELGAVYQGKERGGGGGGCCAAPSSALHVVTCSFVKPQHPHKSA